MVRNGKIGCGALLAIAVFGILAWLLVSQETTHGTVPPGHLLDWFMGALGLFWLLVILKVPWDLYFQAMEVNFELQRSKEREVAIAPDRERYIAVLRKRLLMLAVGAHIVSAAVICAATYGSHGQLGYYFAAFYLLSTVFRPAIAGYVYLTHKLKTIGQEVRYPRDDVREMLTKFQEQQEKLQTFEVTLRNMAEQVHQGREALAREVSAREAETRELRQSVHNLGREFETTVSRLTDNQEVIKGIQAFVRLIAQSTQTGL